MNTSPHMEKRILNAAENLFIKKGFKGTSTTEIAKAAGCNQALIHYYFRTKENLFSKIFDQKVEVILNIISGPLNEDVPFEDKLKNIISSYFDFLVHNENLPRFLLEELLLNQKRRSFIIKQFEANTSRFQLFLQFDKTVKDEVASGHIRDIDTFNLIMDIFSLCFSTFIAMPILLEVAGNEVPSRNDYLAFRKEEITNLIIFSLKKCTMSGGLSYQPRPHGL